MNLQTSIPQRETIATVQFLPAVSIIVPFAPVITPKNTLEYSLKNIMSRVESILTANYTVEKAIPVIIKLRNLINTLNYNTHKKSLAIFVSPVVDKVYYLETEMEEKIIIDPAFKFSDLVFCKHEKKEYLILLLSNNYSKMFVGNGSQLKLIKYNTLCCSQRDEKINEATDDVLIYDDKQNECVRNRFLLQMDQGLSIILKSYRLPVFVVGVEKVFSDFQAITINDENIVDFIQGNYGEAEGTDWKDFTNYILSSWQKLKDRHLLKQVEKAKRLNKLSAGMQEISEASLQSKGKLLVIEKQFLNRPNTSKSYNTFFKTGSVCNEEFFIKDETDDIIKNLLESGTKVELIDNGLLKNYGNIALIERN